MAKLNARAKQYGLFAKSDNPFEVVRKLPYKFSFVFSDITGKACTVMIEDWETGQLYLIAPNPFVIIGTFHPKKKIQLDLF